METNWHSHTTYRVKVNDPKFTKKEKKKWDDHSKRRLNNYASVNNVKTVGEHYVEVQEGNFYDVYTWHLKGTINDS